MNHAISIKLAELLVDSEYNEKNLRYVKIAYSLECTLGEVEKFFIVYVIFSLQHKGFQFFVCLLETCLTRMFLGGIHMKTVYGCTLYTLIVYIIAIYVGEKIVFSIPLCMIIVVHEMVCIWKYAPISSESRPHYTNQQKKHFKVQGLLGTLICIVLCFIYPMLRNQMFCIMILQQLETYIALYMQRKGV